MHSLFFLPMGLLISAVDYAQAQQACMFAQPLTQRLLHEQPIYINTDVLTNTTFYPMSGIGVTIENAPTSLSGVTTFTWTETKTYNDYSRSTRTFAAASATTTPADMTFVMMALGTDRHEKRQSGASWVNANGTMTNDCSNTPIYTVTNGVLTATVNGTIYTYSTSPNVPFAPFIPSTSLPGLLEILFTR